MTSWQGCAEVKRETKSSHLKMALTLHTCTQEKLCACGLTQCISSSAFGLGVKVNCVQHPASWQLNTRLCSSVKAIWQVITIKKKKPTSSWLTPFMWCGRLKWGDVKTSCDSFFEIGCSPTQLYHQYLFLGELWPLCPCSVFHFLQLKASSSLKP